jgi:lipopolysaccharide transport system ATP-binding protein
MKDVSEQEGKTVLFVSHNMAAVHALCTSCLYLKAGQVAAYGPTGKVMSEYLCAQTDTTGQSIRERTDRTGNGKMRCTGITFFDMNNAPIQAVPTKQPFYIEVSFESKENLKDITVSIDVDTVEGSRVTTLYSGFYNATFDVVKGPGTFRCYVKHLPLRPDNYSLNTMLGNEQEAYDFVSGAAMLDVQESVYPTGRAPGKAYGDLLASFEWSLAEEIA